MLVLRFARLLLIEFLRLVSRCAPCPVATKLTTPQTNLSALFLQTRHPRALHDLDSCHSLSNLVNYSKYNNRIKCNRCNRPKRPNRYNNPSHRDLSICSKFNRYSSCLQATKFTLTLMRNRIASVTQQLHQQHQSSIRAALSQWATRPSLSLQHLNNHLRTT